MTYGDLFAGIGGMSLGLERAGMECRFQVEIDPFCQKVLAKHWPHVRRYGDIRTVSELEPVDLIAGGFPCQDISYAGRGEGIDGERSGLWSEMLRIIRLARPRFVLVENVPALLTRGLERVLGQLAEIGYDAEWSVLSACALGAPHTRERLFVLAYAHGEFGQRWMVTPDRSPEAVARVPDQRGGHRQHAQARAEADSRLRSLAEWWRIEPGVGRMATGIPRRMDRLKSLGNAVVPQVAEWIGHRIMEAAA